MAKLFVSDKGVTIGQLKAVMIFQLGNFNSTGVKVDENTIHQSILKDDDGVTATSSSKKLYKGIVRFTIVANNHEDKLWPTNWMELSITDLANRIF